MPSSYCHSQILNLALHPSKFFFFLEQKTTTTTRRENAVRNLCNSLHHSAALFEKTIETSDRIGFAVYIIQLFCMLLQVPLELYYEIKNAIAKITT